MEQYFCQIIKTRKVFPRDMKRISGTKQNQLRVFSSPYLHQTAEIRFYLHFGGNN